MCVSPRSAVFLAIAALACADPVPLEPVRFTPAQPELFADGGTLTDAWADVDGDGDPDRFVGFNGAASRLYRNDLLDGFVDIAADVGLAVERAVRTSAWGDFDRDGDPDLLLGFAGDAPVTALYRNDGPSGFVDVAADVGLRLEAGATRQASWIDYDEDGDLDLFLAMRDRPNHLFENRGPSGFADVAEEVGMIERGRTVGATWFDVGDGRLDLIVANMDGDANTLWIQEAGGFRADGGGPVAGGGRALGDAAQGSVRPCVVDHDNDGDFDLFFANYGPNGLLESDPGAGTYTDVAPRLGLAIDARYDTCAWGDFDNDGALDLYVNGTVTGGVQYRDWLFRREGGESFVDVTPPELLELAADHGATWVDFDLDGDLDLALTGAGEDGMHHLMRNLLRPERAGHSLQVRVLDAQGVAAHAGAEVRVYAAGTDRLLGTRLVDAGSGYDAQSDLPVHFGLPGDQPVDVTVTVLGSGARRTATVAGVEPGAYLGRALILRIDRAGGVVR